MRGRTQSTWSFLRQYRFRSLLIRNFCFVIVLVIIPLLILVSFGYSKLTNEMNLRLMDMNEDLLNRNAAVTDNILEGMFEVQLQLAEHPLVMEVLTSPAGSASLNENIPALFAIIHECTQHNGYIQDVYLYSDVNNLLIIGANSTCQDAYKCYDKQKWYYVHKQYDIQSSYVLFNGVDRLLFCLPLHTAAQNPVGILVLDVGLQEISNVLERDGLGKSGCFFIVSPDGQIIYCNQKTFFNMTEKTQRELREQILQIKPGENKISIDGTRKMISVIDSDHERWRYVYITELSAYEEESAMLSSFLFTSSLLCLMTGILTAYIITRVTYRPVQKIMEVIEQPSEHQEHMENARQSDELIYITSNILNTISSKSQTEQELQHRMQALHQAQALALQRQIDPHFLYNTLETIKWTAIEENGRGSKTGRLITKAAKLYRICLEGNDIIVSLREELEFLSIYADLLNARFAGNIQFVWNVDETLYDCNVVKLSIQPLIENAVNHGLMPCDYYGTITVTALKEHDHFVIMVDNDGITISEQQVQDINRRLKKRDDFGGKKVGLRNVNERIKLIFGERYGVVLSRIATEERVITRTSITLPYTQAQQERSSI